MVQVYQGYYSWSQECFGMMPQWYCYEDFMCEAKLLRSILEWIFHDRNLTNHVQIYLFSCLEHLKKCEEQWEMVNVVNDLKLLLLSFLILYLERYYWKKILSMSISEWEVILVGWRLWDKNILSDRESRNSFVALFCSYFNKSTLKSQRRKIVFCSFANFSNTGFKQ